MGECAAIGWTLLDQMPQPVLPVQCRFRLRLRQREYRAHLQALHLLGCGGAALVMLHVLVQQKIALAAAVALAPAKLPLPVLPTHRAQGLEAPLLASIWPAARAL